MKNALAGGRRERDNYVLKIDQACLGYRIWTGDVKSQTKIEKILIRGNGLSLVQVMDQWSDHLPATPSI